MDLDKEVEFFDRFEATHEDYDVLGPLAYSRLLGMFARMVRSRPGQSCIDLGCGSGAFTKRLDPFGLKVTGMDISPRLIARANADKPIQQQYLVGDIMATGLPDRSFDIIVYSGVLHHFPTAEDRLRVLREGRRLLRPGGHLFAYDPYAFSPSMFLYRDPRSPFYSSLGKTENEVLLSKAVLGSELEQAGFSEVALRPLGGVTFRFVEGPLARRLLPLYNVYEWLLMVTGLERIFGTFLISHARAG
jgi:SAM-dependent methyltransferase